MNPTGDATVEVPVDGWVEGVRRARDELGYRFFDWLSAVDELEDGFAVVTCLWRLGTPAHTLLLRTRVPRARPQVPSLVGVFAGAAWHERETYEMFGIEFEGHPRLAPLLLPDGFDGHPLRKEFVLAARAAKPWPGAKEPGESDRDVAAEGADRTDRSRRAAPGRRRATPPGVPDPATWGPRPPPGTP